MPIIRDGMVAPGPRRKRPSPRWSSLGNSSRRPPDSDGQTRSPIRLTCATLTTTGVSCRLTVTNCHPSGHPGYGDQPRGAPSQALSSSPDQFLSHPPPPARCVCSVVYLTSRIHTLPPGLQDWDVFIFVLLAVSALAWDGVCGCTQHSIPRPMAVRSTSGTSILRSRLADWEHKPDGSKQAKQLRQPREFATTAGHLLLRAYLPTTVVCHLLASLANAAGAQPGTRPSVLALSSYFATPTFSKKRDSICIIAMLDRV
ncbi:hypothetical protein CSAL01_09294 [Colletotrichum salicis]|uniref:Uncharacterized protein n=1 Tax=Colletotrichum salicis TaxID=1209931 RepID=A0A135SCZ0_9PEZI|nr:hypothetical protein CSAL01_09294 [Colletotrichum salicis]